MSPQDDHSSPGVDPEHIQLVAAAPRTETVDGTSLQGLTERKRSGALIQIGLATYESERFLPELLASLVAQTERRFTLLIADDGSQDATLSILQEYDSHFPESSVRLAEDRQRLGPIGNFGRIIDLANTQYLMFCDHDDVWLPDKVSRSLTRMVELEREHGAATPILVHTDLVVTAGQLNTISRSFFDYIGIDPSRTDIASLLTANVSTGCTMIMNRALYERARPIPAEAMMHDHWLALVAAAIGVIGAVSLTRTALHTMLPGL